MGGFNRREAWRVYAQHMSSRDCGRAMWLPDQPQPEITIGDVGFIDRETGAFRRLFNVTRPREDELNKDFPLPEDYQVLGYNPILETHKEGFLEKQPYCSRNVTADRIAQPGGESDADSSETQYKFFSSKSRGAVLYLDDAADQAVVSKNEVWIRYIKENYPAWIASLKEPGLRVELIVVRGWVKASAWAIAAWCNKGEAREIILSGSGSIAQAGVTFKTPEEGGPVADNRIGPLDKQDLLRSNDPASGLKRDQCIFMSYFKVVDRVVWFSLKAKAGEIDLPPGDCGNRGKHPVDVEPQDVDLDETRDPLDDVVDYIFSVTKTQYAIVSDADPYELCDGHQIPKNFPEYLRTLAPRCDTIGLDVAYLSIIESICKDHEHTEQHQHFANQGELQGHDGGRLILPGTQPIRWPHVTLMDRETEYGRPSDCPTATLSQNGLYLGLSLDDSVVHVWNMKTRQLAHRLQGHEDAVLCTAFSSDGKLIVSGSADCTAIMWDVDSGRIKRRLEGHEGDVWSVAFSPDDKTLATGSVDTKVRLWNTTTGEMFATGEGHTAVVQSILFAPDGSLVVSCADMVGRTWDPRNGTALSVMQGHTGVIWTLCCSRNSAIVATGSEDHTVRIWDTGTGDELVTIRDHTGPVWSVQFSPDDHKVISGSYDTTITIHDAVTGDFYFSLRADDSVVQSIAYSPIGNVVAGGYADGSLKLWDGNKGTQIAKLLAHTGKVMAVIFSPEEDSIITSSDDKTVRVWSMMDIMRVCY